MPEFQTNLKLPAQLNGMKGKNIHVIPETRTITRDMLFDSDGNDYPIDSAKQLAHLSYRIVDRKNKSGEYDIHVNNANMKIYQNTKTMIDCDPTLEYEFENGDHNHIASVLPKDEIENFLGIPISQKPDCAEGHWISEDFKLPEWIKKKLIEESEKDPDIKRVISPKYLED